MSKAKQRKVSAFAQGRRDAREGLPKRKVGKLLRIPYHFGYATVERKIDVTKKKRWWQLF